MNVLDRYFGIFKEGTNDEKYRSKVRDVATRLTDALKSVKPIQLKTPQSGKPIVSVDIGDILKDDEFKGLELWFVARPDNEKRVGLASYSKGKIKIFVDIPTVTFSKMNPESWSKVVVKNASTIMDRTRDAFIHELIHFYDFNRAGSKDVMKKTAAAGTLRDPKKYYNDPMEFNAHVQAGLSRVEDHLSKLGTWSEAEKLIGKTPDEFMKLVLKVLPPGMKKHMEDKFKRKLQKRVAQMWTQTKKRFSGGEKNA